MMPTARTLKLLREQGYTAAVVEKWIPQIRQRKDLFGIGDVLALRDREILLVQCTSGSNVASRVTKIACSDHVDAIRKAGIRIVVHGWRKLSDGRWHVREIDCS